jgi:uncharacterized protein (TIGR04255 family)
LYSRARPDRGVDRARAGFADTLVMDSPLPDFVKPPVTEVVLGMQFARLPQLRNITICRLWQEHYKSRFPDVEEHPPIGRAVEKFGVITGPPSFRVVGMDSPPVPRYWFVNGAGAAGTELVQVQQDRFLRNWRKMGDADQYPRYERIREWFQRDASTFLAFVEANKLGEVIPDQCEVTYVNHIFPSGVWKHHGEVGKVVSFWSGQHSDDFLPPEEDATLTARYIIPDQKKEPLGRLSVTVQPAYAKDTEEHVLQMTLVARGRPIGEGMAGVLKFFDLGREWVVRGFASITTRVMHQTWERRDVRN